jgi:hypothetical protein
MGVFEGAALGMAKSTAPASDSYTNLMKSLEIQFEKYRLQAWAYFTSIMAPLLSFLGAYFSFILWPLRSFWWLLQLFWWLLQLFGGKVSAYASSSWDQLMRIYHQPGVDFHGMVSKVTAFPSSCMSKLLLFSQYHNLELEFVSASLVLVPILSLASLFYLVLKRYGPDAEDIGIEGLPINIYFFLFCLIVFVAIAIAAFNNIENIQWALQLLPSSITEDVIVVSIVLFALALWLFIAFFGDWEGGPQHPFVIAMEDWTLLLVRTLTAPLRWLWAITFGRIGTSASETAALRLQLADLSVQLAALGTSTTTGEMADLKVQLADLKAQQAAVNADIETLEAKLLGGDDESPGAPAVPGAPVVPHPNADGKDEDATISNWVLWIQTGERQKLIDDAVDNSAVVNPMEDRPGPGRLLFLSYLDRQEANRRGYAIPHDAWMARRLKELSDPSGPNTGPSVVFWPKPETLEEEQWLL